LNSGYDRSGRQCFFKAFFQNLNKNTGDRFKVKLDKLFGLHIGPKADDQVWIELNAVKAELQTPLDVRTQLRQFKIKNKHYDCCRIFCDTFTNFKVVVVEAIHLNKILLRKFENIHSSWRAYTPYEPFFSSVFFFLPVAKSKKKHCFSYDYLLRYLLTEANCPLIAYCKPPTSRRRRNKYDEKLRLIQARQKG
jgi:hypothetical protein